MSATNKILPNPSTTDKPAIKPSRELIHDFTCEVVRITGESVYLNIDDCEVPVAIINVTDFSEVDQPLARPGVMCSWKIYYQFQDGRKFRVSEVRVKA